MAFSIIVGLPYAGGSMPLAVVLALIACLLVTIIVICIYVVTNINVVFYLRERRSEFNVLLNLVVPVLGVLVFLPALLASLGIDFAGLGITPLGPPANPAPYIVAAWLVLGLVALLTFRARAPERIQETGAVLVE